MRFLHNVTYWSGVIITATFTLVPESAFDIKSDFISFIAKAASLAEHDLTIFTFRLSFAVLVVVLVSFFLWLRSTFRKSITFEGHDYVIKAKYGDLLTEKNCKKIINFDECFTSRVGNAPGDINPNSLCGHFLLKYPELNIDRIVSQSGLQPTKECSRFNSYTCYKSGSIVQHGDYLLMAFAPLNSKGLAHFPSVKDYLDCLFNMWEEIDKYSRQCDVCIPVLGSGRTRVGTGTGYSYSEQDFVNMIIWSYMLSPYKVKKPNQLRIICSKSKDFSLDKIRI